MSGFETDDLFSQKTIGLDHQLGMERKEEVWEAGGSARCRIVFSRQSSAHENPAP